MPVMCSTADRHQRRRGQRERPVLTWTTASVAPGASETFTVTVQVGTHAHGTVLAAGALSATPDPDLLNNAAVRRIRLG